MSTAAPDLPPGTDLHAGAARTGRSLRTFVAAVLIAVAAGSVMARIVQIDLRYSPSRWPRARPASTPFFSANDRSRWCTVWSLVERGTFQIDEIIQQPGWNTIDKVRFQDHFYSTKPPLLSLLLAGLYAGLKWLTGWTLLTQPHRVAATLLLLVNGIPFVAYLVVLARLTERYAKTDATRFFVLTTGAFGTFLSTFAITLNNHTVAAHCVLFALYPALRVLVDREQRPLYFVLAGFWSACACCNEMPAALLVVALFGLLFRSARRRTLTWFLPAALVPLAAFFTTLFLQTGGFRPFYAFYGTDLYNYVHNGVASYWTQPAGIDKGEDSFIVYLLNCTLGHHGIWSLSPVFLLSVAGWATVRRTAPAELRPFQWLSLGLTVAVLGFYLTRLENYNYGGLTSGLRWMFWLIPFWLLSMLPIIDAWQERRWFPWACVILLAISVFSVTVPQENPWQHPWLFNLLTQWGWINYR